MGRAAPAAAGVSVARTPAGVVPAQVMNNVQIAAKLYDCRDTAKRLLGTHFKRDMELWAKAIRSVAESDKSTELAAAQKMATATDSFGVIVILSAFVEMTDPE